MESTLKPVQGCSDNIEFFNHIQDAQQRKGGFCMLLNDRCAGPKLLTENVGVSEELSIVRLLPDQNFRSNNAFSIPKCLLKGAPVAVFVATE